MLKRLFKPVRDWFAPDVAQQHAGDADSQVDATRRGFFKRAALGTASVGGTAGLAATVIDRMPKPDMKQQYLKDAHNGEKELMAREYVLMSEQEKKDMLKMMIDSNTEQS